MLSKAFGPKELSSSISHSFGGETSAHISVVEKRCKSAVILDGSYREYKQGSVLVKPTFWLFGSSTYGPPTEELKQFFVNERRDLILYLRTQSPKTYAYYMKGADHWTFSDQWILDPYTERETNAISGKEGVVIVRKFITSFLTSLDMKGDRGGFINPFPGKVVDQLSGN